MVAPGLSRSMWNLVPRPGIEPRSPALGVWSLSHRTTREIHTLELLKLPPGTDTLHWIKQEDHISILEAGKCNHAMCPEAKPKILGE